MKPTFSSVRSPALRLFAAILALGSAPARAEGVDFAGETKLRGFYLVSEPPAKDAHQLDLAGRLTATYATAAAWQFEASYELIAGTRGGDFPTATGKRRYRADDLPFFALDASSGEFIAQNFDRAMATYTAGDSGLTVDIGRQPIAFGSGQMVNPTDVIAPKPLGALPSDIRAGVDGLRTRKLIGEVSQLDAGIVAPSSGRLADSAVFAAATLSLGATELRPIVATFYRAAMLGLDAATTVGGAGLWWESAYVKPPARNGRAGTKELGYLRSVLGAMRQLSPLSQASLEYHYNGAGKAEVADYRLLSARFAYRQGSVTLLGRHYLGLTANLMITPLLTYSQQLVANVTDRSAFVRAGVDWELWPDNYLALHLRHGFGPGRDSRRRPRSEFGGGSAFFYGALHSYY